MSKKISDLTSATTPLAGTELVEIVQSGVSKKVAASYLTGISGGREMLVADRTYYVRTDGSDSNNGLANTSGGAFLTIQKAANVIAALDCAIYNATIQAGDGTYTGAITLPRPLGSGLFTLQGNSGTPTNVIISVTSGHCVSVTSGGAWAIKDMKLQTTTSGWALVVRIFSSVEISNLNFGACASGHIYQDAGGSVSVAGNYTISGGAPYHHQISGGAMLVCTGRTITLSGTPAFSTGYIVANQCATTYLGGNTYSGSATGKRYDSTLNAVINTNGGGATYLPGNSAGTTATGGQYA